MRDLYTASHGRINCHGGSIWRRYPPHFPTVSSTHTLPPFILQSGLAISGRETRFLSRIDLLHFYFVSSDSFLLPLRQSCLRCFPRGSLRADDGNANPKDPPKQRTVDDGASACDGNTDLHEGPDGGIGIRPGRVVEGETMEFRETIDGDGADAGFFISKWSQRFKWGGIRTSHRCRRYSSLAISSLSASVVSTM